VSATGLSDITTSAAACCKLCGVKFYLRTVLGSLIALGATALFVFGIYQVARGGTCASGGPYVSTKECAPGSTAWMFALPPVLLVGFCGLWLVKLRGPRPGVVQPSPVTAAPGARSRDVLRPGIVMSRDQLFATLTAATAPTPAADPLVRLEKLQALLDAGVLSPDEFQQAKAKILAEM
jgi:hypothetical protein